MLGWRLWVALGVSAALGLAGFKIYTDPELRKSMSDWMRENWPLVFFSFMTPFVMSVAGGATLRAIEKKLGR